MIKPKHTPTPWMIGKKSEGQYHSSLPITDGYDIVAEVVGAHSGMVAGYTGRAAMDANAAFIIHCCNNAYKISACDDLVAIVQSLLNWDAANNEFGEEQLHVCKPTYEQAFAAIAKARGEA